MHPEDSPQERDVRRLADRATGHFADCKKSEHRFRIKKSDSKSENESGHRADFTTDCVLASG